MTPEAFTEKLKEALGQRLLSVVLYGSAAVGDPSAGYSDVNLLVVCDAIGVAELDALAPLAKDWARLGNPPPLLFAEKRLLNSAHVFPIELLDIKENHRLLFGRDILRALPIGQSNLRFQLEHELKGKLVQLREQYLLISREAPDILELMLRTLSAFQIMAKAALRFYEVRVPPKKRDAVTLLKRHVLFDLSILEELQEMRDGARELPRALAETQALFARYLEVIERSADLIANLGSQRY